MTAGGGDRGDWDSGSAADWDSADPGRLYVITGGRSGLSDAQGDGRIPDLDLVTLIISRAAPRPGTQPEHAAILRLCHDSPLSVAELSAYLHLPISIIMVLLADLLANKRIEARAPIPRAQLPDPALLEAVMHGLQKL